MLLHEAHYFELYRRLKEVQKYSELKFTHKNIDIEAKLKEVSQIDNLIDEISPRALKKKPLPPLTSVQGINT